MTGTAFLTAAYDDTMELMLLLYLLSVVDADPALKNSLKSFLSFYKENRELIASLTSSGAPASAFSGSTQEKPHDVPQEQSRPREEVGVKNVLEEYLRRASL